MKNYFDRFEFGRSKFEFKDPMSEMKLRIDNMNFKDRFKIDKPHPDIMKPNPFNRPMDTQAMDSFFQAHMRQSLLDLTRKF